ncbi:SIMPL domain-containing protein [Telluria beijingensis]|uniref:SIMPL domain-containing protein n=1 Tax=Telluria beijingensis TaxID=3068633 RepID=UPI0027955A78|nr:SIMPL domain-containing protein [Massilia sp. REN29]
MLKKLAAAFAAIAATIVVPAQAADLPSYPFIHVNAAASLHVMPDTGEIDFEIVSLDPDLEAAWKLVAERLEASRALLARHGVALEDISVQDLLRRPIKQGDQVQAIETRAAVHATVRDLNGWTALIQALMTTPNLESLAVAFSRSDADTIEAELVKQALGSARLKAQNIARGINARLGPANGVALAPLKNLSNAMGLASDGPRYTPVTAPGDPLLVTVQKLVQGVDVIYRIGK